MFRNPLRLSLGALTLLLLAAPAFPADPFPLPKPAESFDSGTLHVDKFGSGPQTLILIPGLAGGPWVWSSTIAKFAPDHTIYVLTLPGFHGHPATDKKPLFATFSTDFWALLADRKIQKPVIIGHSLGGTLAISLAEEFPDRLSGIAAIDGLPVFPMLAYATPAQQKAVAAQMTAMFSALNAEQLIANQKTYIASNGTTKPELVEPAATLNAKSDPQAIAAWLQEDLTNDLRPNLSKAVLPLLEIMPFNNPDAKPPMAYTLEQTLAFYKSLLSGAPQVTVAPIESCRHFVMFDQPDKLNKILAEFLQSIQH